MMHLVPLLESAQNRDRVGHCRLAHVHRLEAALERGVLLDVFAILVERGRTHDPQLAAGQHRLEHVAGIHGALGGAGANERVHFVDERDELALGRRDLLEHRLEALLELTAEFGAGDERAQIERHEPLVLETLGHVAVHDALRESFHDGGLADARLADEHRVVLGATRQHLHHASDFFVATNHRIEFALSRGLGEIARESLQSLVLRLRTLVGHAVRSANRLERLEKRVAIGANGLEDLVALGAAHRRKRHEHVLGRDVLVFERLGFLFGLVENLIELARSGRLRAA